MPPPLDLPFTLPFEDTIEAATRRAVLPEIYYTEIPAAARSVAWTVSGIGTLGQIQAVLDSLEKARVEGRGFNEWRKEALKQSWKLPEHRLELIFRNQAQNAYSAGHWRQFEETKRLRPYLMYSAVDDARTRPAHAALSGYIALVDDVFWRTHTPPLGHNCRCSQISLSPAQAQARGYGRMARPTAQADDGFGRHPLDAQRTADTYFSEQAIAAGPQVAKAATEFLLRRP